MLPTSAAGAGTDAGRLFGTDRGRLFDSYAADIRDGQHLSVEGFRRLGTTWERELERSRRRFLDARTREEAYFALLSLRNSVHDGHSSLAVPDSLKLEEKVVHVPLSLTVVDNGGALEYRVFWSGAESIKAGFLLTGFQGRSVAEARYEAMEWLSNNSSDQLDLQLAHWLIRRFSPHEPLPEGPTARYEFRDPASGRTVVAELPWKPGGREREDPTRPTPETDYAGWACDFTGINYCVYADTAADALVLRFSSYFSLEDFLRLKPALSYAPKTPLKGSDPRRAAAALAGEDLEHLASYLKRRNTRFKKLLIDLREGSVLFNGSFPGNRRLLEILARGPFRSTTAATVFVPLLSRDPEFLARAFPEGWPLGESLKAEMRRGTKISPPRAFADCATPLCRPGEGDGRPPRTGVQYRLYLLSGPRCASACDQLVSTVKDNGLGEVLGLPSGGSSSPAREAKSFRLADGQTFELTLNFGITYRANGEVLEGNPAGPEKNLYPRPGYLREILSGLR